MAIVVGDKICIYSLIDHDEIIKYNWYNKNGYARTKINEKEILMHRMIMKCPDDKVVDHINNNKLDNRRENLRITTKSVNNQNKKKRLGSMSQYLGISYSDNRYRAYITVNGKHIYIGGYEDEIEAAEARDMYIVHELPDSIYPLNFPQKYEEYKQTPYEKFEKRPLNKKTSARPIDKTDYECTDCDEVIRILIPSQPNAYVTIDTEDYEKVRYMRFCMSRGYVVSPRHGALHRLIMEVSDPNILVDHIDGNKSNNVKQNLRLSNATLNSQNKIKKSGTTSKYLGVHRVTQSLGSKPKYRAAIQVNGKGIVIGIFDNEKEAAKMRDDYILENYPDSHYKLNFPDN